MKNLFKKWLKKSLGAFLSVLLLVNITTPIFASSGIKQSGYISDRVSHMTGEVSSAKFKKIDLKNQKTSLSLPEQYSVHDKISDSYQLSIDQTKQFDYVLPNVSVRYRMQKQGLKEDYILHSKKAQNSFVIQCIIGSLQAKQINSKDILLLDSNNKANVLISAPCMTDANGKKSDALSLQIIDNKDGLLLMKLTADASWLQAPERQYPVEVDPWYVDLVVGVGISLVGAVAVPFVGVGMAVAIGAGVGAVANGTSEAIQQANSGQDMSASKIAIKAVGGAAKGAFGAFGGGTSLSAAKAALSAGAIARESATLVAAEATKNALAQQVAKVALGQAVKNVVGSALTQGAIVVGAGVGTAGAAETLACVVADKGTEKITEKDIAESVASGAAQGAAAGVAFKAAAGKVYEDTLTKEEIQKAMKMAQRPAPKQQKVPTPPASTEDSQPAPEKPSDTEGTEQEETPYVLKSEAQVKLTTFYASPQSETGAILLINKDSAGTAGHMDIAVEYNGKWYYFYYGPGGLKKYELPDTFKYGSKNHQSINDTGFYKGTFTDSRHLKGDFSKSYEHLVNKVSKTTYNGAFYNCKDVAFESILEGSFDSYDKEYRCVIGEAIPKLPNQAFGHFTTFHDNPSEELENVKRRYERAFVVD